MVIVISSGSNTLGSLGGFSIIRKRSLANIVPYIYDLYNIDILFILSLNYGCFPIV